MVLLLRTSNQNVHSIVVYMCLKGVEGGERRWVLGTNTTKELGGKSKKGGEGAK